MFRRRHNLESRAFTLVELLVVTAIVAILAALVMAVLPRMTSHAAKTKCVSNLRQLGGSLMLFSQENNGDVPSPRTGGTNYWYDELFTYLHGTWREVEGRRRIFDTIFECPAAEADIRRTGTDDPTTAFLRSYGMNSMLPVPDAATGRIRLRNILRPASAMLLMDAKTSPLDFSLVDLRIASVSGRHNSVWNVLYADGHVAPVGLDEVPRQPNTPAGRLFWRGLAEQ